MCNAVQYLRILLAVHKVLFKKIPLRKYSLLNIGFIFPICQGGHR